MQRHRNGGVTPDALPEEKRREEKKKKPPKSPSGGFDPRAVELPFGSTRFREAWLDWCQHRLEIKKKLTKTSVKRQMKQFREWGDALSIQVIEHTIAKGWQGLRAPEKGEMPDPNELQYENGRPQYQFPTELEMEMKNVEFLRNEDRHAEADVLLAEIEERKERGELQ